MSLSIEGPEIDQAAASIHTAAKDMSKAAMEIESQVAAWSEQGATVYEPKILTLLKWAKAAFIAVCFASFAIIIAALSIIIG